MQKLPESILIIDDTPANLEVIVAYLAEAGFQTMVARTGEIGLEIARRAAPDLILLDVMLPGLDGFEVCQRLKAEDRTQAIPVLFMTVMTNVEDKVKGFQVGGVDYIAKPFQLEEVLARVNTHLTLHRLQQELRELNRSLEDKVIERTAELAKANRAYQALSDCNQALLRATEEPDLLHEVCQIIQQDCGYRLVWIGLAEQNETKIVRPVAQAGYENGYLETVRMSWAENEWGYGPTGTAIRTETSVVNRDILTNPAFAPWRDEALKRGYASSAAIPLATAGRVLGALNVYAAEPDAFTPEEVGLLTEIAHDLAYGIESLRLRVERQQAEEALRESETRYRQLFEDSPISLWYGDLSDVEAYFDRLRVSGVTDFRTYFDTHPEAVMDCVGLMTILDVNQATLALLHARNKEEVLTGLSTLFTPDAYQFFREEFVTLAEGGHRFVNETTHRTLTGERLTVVAQISVVSGYEQTLARVLTSLQDITERKHVEDALQESEARYHRLFEDSPISLWEEDFSAGKACFDRLRVSGVADFRTYFDQHPEAVAECAGLVTILDVNQATLALLHAHNKEELRAGLSRIFTEESLAVFREELIALAEGRSHFVGEAVHKTLTGERLTVLLQLTVVPGYEQTLGRVLVSLQDITARKQAEEELRRHREHLEDLVAERTEKLEQEIIERKHIEHALHEAKDAADAANRAKSIFLANMSHELRTPLNAILGFTQLLRREADLPPARQEKLEAILRSGDHLLKLINDVLDLSKIEAGRMALHCTTVDLWDLLDMLLEMLQGRAERKGLHLTVNRGADVPHYIVADETKLRQVLVNLVGNAIKFTDHGRVTLEVTNVSNVSTVEKDEQESHISHLKFEISDTGSGIAPADLDAVFRPFTQGERGGAQREGTGLGLTISRAFVRLMGGELRATSVVGQGSCFTFELAVERAEAAPLHPVCTFRRVTGLASGQPSYRLLVVDDDQDNRLFLAELLRAVGFEVYEATNGVEAFAHYLHARPHLIWMDIQLPIMNGYDATELIRESEGQAASSTPPAIIIALTGHVFEEDRAQIIAAGCDDLLRKPITETEIFETLRRYLGVQYVYADAAPFQSSPPGSAAGTTPLTPEALAALPPEVLDALERALLEMDRELIARAIAPIGLADPMLAATLTRLVEHFHYADIFTALDQVRHR